MTTKNIIKIACIYTATLLGAGFATGKELVSFFARFKIYGIYGFILSCILLCMLGISILHIVNRTKANTYKEFMEEIFGKKLGIVMEICNTVFLFVLLSAMLAGGGATISNIFGIDETVSISLFGIVVFMSLIFGKRAVINLNTVICPLLILGGLFIGIYLCLFKTETVFHSMHKPIISSFVYASYNTITTISILFSLKNLIVNRKIIVFGGILSGVFVFFIGIFMLIPLVFNYDFIKYSNLPILSLLSQDKIIMMIYSITVLLAIFTTALGNGFALFDAIKDKIKIKNTMLKMSIIFFGICFSYFGFSNMIEIVYPIFGYIGIFECLVIFITFCIDK